MSRHRRATEPLGVPGRGAELNAGPRDASQALLLPAPVPDVSNPQERLEDEDPAPVKHAADPSEAPPTLRTPPQGAPVGDLSRHPRHLSNDLSDVEPLDGMNGVRSSRDDLLQPITPRWSEVQSPTPVESKRTPLSGESSPQTELIDDAESRLASTPDPLETELWAYPKAESPPPRPAEKDPATLRVGSAKAPRSTSFLLPRWVSGTALTALGLVGGFVSASAFNRGPEPISPMPAEEPAAPKPLPTPSKPTDSDVKPYDAGQQENRLDDSPAPAGFGYLIRNVRLRDRIGGRLGTRVGSGTYIRRLVAHEGWVLILVPPAGPAGFVEADVLQRRRPIAALADQLAFEGCRSRGCLSSARQQHATCLSYCGEPEETEREGEEGPWARCEAACRLAFERCQRSCRGGG